MLARYVVHPLARRWRVAVCLRIGCAALGALATATADAAPATLPGTDARWKLIQSPNFTLYSHQGETESRGILYDLEILRGLFIDRFKFVERARRDVTVYAFAGRKEFEAYAPARGKKKSKLGGFYLPYPDRAVIVLAPSEGRDEARQLIFHEYVHHLFKAAEQDPPVWFNEGTAELLAGIRIEGDKLQFGHPLPDRIRILRTERLLALETIFGVTHQSRLYQSDEHTGLFYAQSWALLHYWFCGKSDLPREGIKKFTDLIAQPIPITNTQVYDAFQACFGMSYMEMNKRLEKYVTSGTYGYSTQPLPEVEPIASYTLNPVPVDDIRIRLGELSYRVTRSAAGEAIVREAVLSRPQDPLPLELLGAIAAADGDARAAASYWERAVAAGTTNPALLRELALIECQEWMQDFNFDLRLTADETARLRKRLLRSIEHEPHQSAAYEMLAWVEAFADDRSIANINIVQRQFNELPKRAKTLVALALVRARMGSAEAALKLLKSLPDLHPDLWTLQAAETISARLENRPVQRLGDASRGVEVSADAGPVVRSTRRIPSVPLPEDL